MVGLPAALIFWGAGAELGMSSTALALVGLWIAVDPPPARATAAPALAWCALAGVLAAGALLPAAAEPWRREAWNLGIPVAAGANPQPWASVMALVPWLAASAGLWRMAGRPLEGEARWRAAQAWAWVLALFAGSVVVGNAGGWQPPRSDWAQVFSWFPNKNQTATVLACGAVFCVGLGSLPRVADLRLRLLCWAGGGVSLIALAQTHSRGALIAAAGGFAVLLWTFRRGIGRARAWWRVLPAVALFALTAFLVFGGQLRDRSLRALSPAEEAGGGAFSGFRAKVYEDAAGMVAERPWLGVGPGNFRYVFPQYREASVSDNAVWHPESDLIWWAAELGALGLLAGGAGAVSLARRAARDRMSDDPTLRGVAAAALAPVILHSLVDVGGHRLGTVFVAIVFYALTLPPPDHGRAARARGRFAAARAVGAGLFVVGVVGAGLALARSPATAEGARALAAPDERWPMVWEPWMRRGTRFLEVDPAAAAADFRAARFLQPHHPEIALAQARRLLEVAPQRALPVYSAAIRGSMRPRATFERALRDLKKHPELRGRILSAARAHAGLNGVYWTRAGMEAWRGPAGGVADAFAEAWPRLSVADQGAILERLRREKAHALAAELFELSSPTCRRAHWALFVPALHASGAAEAALDAFWAGRERPASGPKQALSEEALNRLRADYYRGGREPGVALRLILALAASERWEAVERLASDLTDEAPAVERSRAWLVHALERQGERDSAVAAAVSAAERRLRTERKQ